jgi:hypothetical protein
MSDAQLLHSGLGEGAHFYFTTDTPGKERQYELKHLSPQLTMTKA